MFSRVFSYIFRFIPLLISVIITVPSLFSANYALLENDMQEQKARISALESAYKNGEAESVDESLFFNGNLEAELNGGLKFNELRYIATHNSYQRACVDEMKLISGNLSELTFGIIKDKSAFCSETLTEQLNSGIYSLEIDIETIDRNGDISFTCLHSPVTDMSTSCYDFSLALKEIAIWSDNNPDHLPVTVIIEPKTVLLALEDMKNFSLDYALELDSLLRQQLGDRLFTPADMLRDYESFAQLRADDGWCEVNDMLGKVLILLHDCSVTNKYINTDPSLKSLAMFPMLRENDTDRDCASFLIINNPQDSCRLSNKLISEGNFIVRTRVDSFQSINEKDRQAAFDSMAQILSTDYPVRSDAAEGDYVVSFAPGKTISPCR